MDLIQPDQCGKADCHDCLMTQISRGDNPDDNAVCSDCHYTLDELDQQVSELGDRLKAAAAEPVAHRAGLKLIADAVASTTTSVAIRDVPAEIASYRIGKLIGRGGMGAVYQATHAKLGKDVAIKLLPATKLHNSGAVARFEREMAAVGQLEHPNVVRALDAGEADGNSYLIMELINGPDVSAIIANGRRLSVADACEIARQAANGLKYAHEQGLVHRDIKPANLMLSEDSQGSVVVKVMDLGLALVSESATSAQLTDQGQLMGTLEFMAPEQAAHSKVDERADIYALGATLFRLLTGTVPFDGPDFDTPVRRLYGLSNSQAPSIRTRRKGLPQALADFVDSMLSRDPHERPRSMGEIARTLKAYASGHHLMQLLRNDGGSHGTVVPNPADTSPTVGNTLIEPANAGHDDSVAAVPREKQGKEDVRSTRLGASRTLWRRWLLAGAAGIALLSGIWLKATDGSYIRVECDPSIDVAVDVIKDGEHLKTIRVNREADRFWLMSGEYELQLPAESKDRLSIVGNRFSLERNGKTVVKVTRVSPGSISIPQPSDEEVSSSSGFTVVNSHASGPGSLRAMISSADDGATIRFVPSMSGAVITLNGQQLLIDRNLAIDASDLPERVTIDAAGLSRVIECTAGQKVSLSNLRLTGGNPGGNVAGGGISSASDLSLHSVVVTANTTFAEGGGLKVQQPGQLKMTNCTISDNKAGNGGGIYTDNASYIIRNCTVSGNEAVADAGGLFQVSSTGTIVNSTFAENTATKYTMGVVGEGGNAHFRNVTISNNIPSTAATAYAMTVRNGSRVEFENCAIAGNGYPVSYDMEIVAANTIYSFSGKNVVGNFHSDFGHKLPGDVITASGDDRLNPMLAKLDFYGGVVQTMPPLPESPLVDSGIAAAVPISLDARGLRRPIDGDGDGTASPDIGAVEYQPGRDNNLSSGEPRSNLLDLESSDVPKPTVRLRTDHLFVRNEGRTVTLQDSWCRITPLVTYTPLAINAKERVEADQEWKALLAREEELSQWGFVPPDWVKETRRIPLKAFGPAQKKISFEVKEGNLWLSGEFENKVSLVDLHDNPETKDVDETTEVGFLLTTYFSIGTVTATHYEFKLWSDLEVAKPPQPETERNVYTPRITNDIRNLIKPDSTFGLRCGEAEFQHFFTFRFVSP